MIDPTPDSSTTATDVCVRLTDGRRCDLPTQYVPEGTGRISGWWHTTDLDTDNPTNVAADHHAIPSGWV